MSRVGRKPITIPQGVDIRQAANEIVVKGPKGELTRAIPEGITMTVEGQAATFSRESDAPTYRARHGLARALVNNMVTGVTEGFSKELEITGVGYKCEVSGSTVTLNLGYSHPIVYELPAGVSCKVEKSRIVVSGIDREKVGLAASKIRSFRDPDPYKQKGVKYVGEQIRKKVGKAGAS